MVVEELEGIEQDTIDFYVEDHDSVMLLQPATVPAREWANKHLHDYGPIPQLSGENYTVETSFICIVLNDIEADGMKWQTR